MFTSLSHYSRLDLIQPYIVAEGCRVVNICSNITLKCFASLSHLE